MCREFLIRRNVMFIPYAKVQKAFINEVILRVSDSRYVCMEVFTLCFLA